MKLMTRNPWLDNWDPEDTTFWGTEGVRVARKNLALSMFAEHLGFAVWVVWTVVVLNLANVGVNLNISDLFILTLLPNLVGSLLRIPYTFAVPRFGGRAWTTVSASLLLVPTVLLAWVVPSHWLAHQSHGMQMWVLAFCATTAGVGGGNFASSMANISHFYPERRKGFALGLNAAGGNLGVAVAQLLVPLAVIIGVPAASLKLAKHHVHLAYAGLMWLPFIVIAALAAWLFMDSLSTAKSDRDAYAAALRHRDTWFLSFLYIGTFGSFIGFSFAMPLVIKYSFPKFLSGHPFIATYLAGLGFVGALVGSLARPVGGRLSDRIGGARVTLACFVGMAAGTGLAIVGVANRNFPLFFASYCLLFVLAGAGNGSTYKMIASRITGPNPTPFTRRRAAAAIGIAGAIGALGGVGIQVVIRQASLHVSSLIAIAKTPAAKEAVAVAHSSWSIPALAVFLCSYAVFAAVTYAIYMRRSLAHELDLTAAEVVREEALIQAK